MVYDPDLDILLNDGYHPQWKRRTEVVIESHALEPSVLPTGRIVATDALFTREDDPFDVTVEPGTYPLYAWVAVFSKRGKEVERRNAALELRITDAVPLTWDMATVPGEEIENLETDDDFFGFSVDTGCGTIADAEAVQALWRWDFDRRESVYIPKPLPEAPVPGYVSAVVDDATGANLAVVGTGWGDGVYPTFIGRDENGEITSFVTDFMLFEK